VHTCWQLFLQVLTPRFIYLLHINPFNPNNIVILIHRSSSGGHLSVGSILITAIEEFLNRRLVFLIFLEPYLKHVEALHKYDHYKEQTYRDIKKEQSHLFGEYLDELVFKKTAYDLLRDPGEPQRLKDHPQKSMLP